MSACGSFVSFVGPAVTPASLTIEGAPAVAGWQWSHSDEGALRRARRTHWGAGIVSLGDAWLSTERAYVARHCFQFSSAAGGLAFPGHSSARGSLDVWHA